MRSSSSPLASPELGGQERGQVRRLGRKAADLPPRGTGCTRISGPRSLSSDSPARASSAAGAPALERRDVGRRTSCGDELADDDVLLEADQMILGAVDGRSVSTRVVSWKDAAARKLEVFSEALVTPSRTVWALRARRLRPGRDC